jgi:hypothetical protein
LDIKCCTILFRIKYYDPTIQRFISEDPIGFASGDFNFYRYVWNNPVNFVDPDGKNPLLAGFLGGLIVGGIDAFLFNKDLCWPAKLKILIFDTATGVLSGGLSVGRGFIGIVIGELGGMGLNAITALNGLIPFDSCKNKKPTQPKEPFCK